ncbi:uncharacterized protein K489DRAFT_383443, partial [Dissoconium aciculare CBS 342.82]|uniref:Uncharacterized protein n=1 Tax=Dissoconium aciculare CBS 342.82 TaxID=1314786 RepID=A0A6J3LZ25_9PEZI
MALGAVWCSSTPYTREGGELSSIIVISSVGGFHSGYVILQSYVDWILGRVGCNVPRVCVARCLWDRR